MQDGDHDESGIELSKVHSSKKASVKSLLKESAFEVLFKLFQQNLGGGQISRWTKFSLVLLSLFQSMQIISVLSAGDSTALWDSYGFLVELLQYTRIDFIMHRLGFLSIFSLVIEGISLVLVLVFFFLVLCVFYKRVPCDLLFSVTRTAIGLYVQFFSMSVLLALFDLSLIHI